LPPKKGSQVKPSDIIGTNMMYRKEVFDKIGGFFHIFDKRGDESTVNKIALRTWEFDISFDSIVFHERPIRLKDWLKMRFENGLYGYLCEIVEPDPLKDKHFKKKNILTLIKMIAHLSLLPIFFITILYPNIISFSLLFLIVCYYIKRHIISKNIDRISKQFDEFSEKKKLTKTKAFFVFLLGSYYEEVGWIKASIIFHHKMDFDNNILPILNDN
jgi:hypothetical protein